MSRKLKSKLGRSTADQIFVRGYDLTADLLGKVSLCLLYTSDAADE